LAVSERTRARGESPLALVIDDCGLATKKDRLGNVQFHVMLPRFSR
jgi:hypothetical protein